jgi:hypothetical protein
MKDKHIPGDWIDRYNENDLNETEKALFEEEMHANPLLKTEVSIDARLDRFLQDENLIDLMGKINEVTRSGSRGSSLRPMFLIAASVLFLLATGGLFYYLRTDHIQEMPGLSVQESKQQAIRIVPGDSMPAKVPDYSTANHDLLASSFEPLPEYDLLTGSVTRSHQLKVISPPANAAVPAGAGVMFEWEGHDALVPVKLILLNNRGIQVSEVLITDSSQYRLDIKGFPDGLYYWKLMADEEMVMMGKIVCITLPKTPPRPCMH